MISKQEKSRMKMIVCSPDYDIIKKIGDELKDKIKSENVVRDTEWETVKALLDREGQVKGIDRIIKELFLNSNNNA